MSQASRARRALRSAADGTSVTKFGWLRGMGALDFAGGTVVHISSGMSALVAAIIVEQRHDREPSKPANVVYVLIGGTLLWFGWFGFNSGSALSSGGLAGLAFLNTHIAAGTGFMTWIVLDVIMKREANPIGAISGAVVGLVAITPAAGFVNTPSSLAFGAIGVILVYFLTILKAKFLPRLFPQLDDSLDVSSAHGFGGIVGCILIGFFADSRVNSSGSDGVFFGGNGRLLGVQCLGVVAVTAYSCAVTAIILLALKYTMGVAYDADKVSQGLDIKVHGTSHQDDKYWKMEDLMKHDTASENK